MEMWFLAAVSGMLLAGISNFGFKIAAKQQFDPNTFIFHSGIVSVIFAGGGLLMLQPENVQSSILVFITVIAGAIAAQGGSLKVVALRYIDTTIFFPLFKLLSPLLAVLFGIVFFAERFALVEWIGIILGLLIPLLLINRAEHARQTDLIKGLIIVVLVSAASSVAAALNKYVIDAGMNEWVTLWYASWGIFVGTVVVMALKLKGIPVKHIISHTTKPLVQAAVFRSTLICASLLCILYAYGHGGDLGIVQTIHSLYIVIPILLSVVMYHEHINWNKAAAVVLSILALAFLG